MAKKKLEAPELWAALITMWLSTLKAENRSAGTIRTRESHLRHLARALDGNPLTVTGDELVQFIAAQNWKPETRKSFTNSVRGFFSWLHVSGRRADDPARALASVKRPHPHPRPCPDAVIMAALAKANAAEKLMLRLGSEAGLRRFEIAQVSARDLMEDLTGVTLIVRGKGDVQRLVPISQDLADEIKRQSAGGYCFPGRWTGHVEASYIGKRVTRLLGKDWTCHSLRHRYATGVYAATHDILLVSTLLGHASVETTQIYVALPDARLRAAVDAVRLA